jgi:hypothetical protein
MKSEQAVLPNPCLEEEEEEEEDQSACSFSCLIVTPPNMRSTILCHHFYVHFGCGMQTYRTFAEARCVPYRRRSFVRDITNS